MKSSKYFRNVKLLRRPKVFPIKSCHLKSSKYFRKCKFFEIFNIFPKWNIWHISKDIKSYPRHKGINSVESTICVKGLHKNGNLVLLLSYHKGKNKESNRFVFFIENSTLKSYRLWLYCVSGQYDHFIHFEMIAIVSKSNVPQTT